MFLTFSRLSLQNVSAKIHFPGFSTAPDAPYTHWKQTVFYLNDYITCKKVINKHNFYMFK